MNVLKGCEMHAEPKSDYDFELRNLSYALSHNVRAPIARLIGLTNLIKLGADPLSQDQLFLIDKMRDTAFELDAIITDLNLILEFKNEVYLPPVMVNFEDEWMHAYSLIQHTLSSGSRVTADFSDAPLLYTSRSIIKYVLINLLDNAIKFQHPDRDLVISVKSRKHDNSVILEFSDNGLGIDMPLFSDDLFGMYKRFHPHLPGKGLGLYTIKTQIEALGGSIRMESFPNGGCTVSMKFVPAPFEFV